MQRKASALDDYILDSACIPLYRRVCHAIIAYSHLAWAGLRCLSLSWRQCEGLTTGISAEETTPTLFCFPEKIHTEVIRLGQGVFRTARRGRCPSVAVYAPQKNRHLHGSSPFVLCDDRNFPDFLPIMSSLLAREGRERIKRPSPFGVIRNEELGVRN